jgi:hypothetical protein
MEAEITLLCPESKKNVTEQKKKVLGKYSF